MATVLPATLTFYSGVGVESQVRAVTITGENVYVTVSGPPSGGSFTWDGSPPGGWLLNPPQPPRPPGSTRAGPAMPKPGVVVPVTFKPRPSAATQATMTVNIQHNNATKSAVPGFPTTVALEGNVTGVGPGALKIVQVFANPPGPDLAGEFVEITNVSGASLDLMGCTVGDFRARRGPRPLFTFGSPFTLDRQQFLRIFTGPGVPPDPAFRQIPLGRGSPVWNNPGDTAWITNPFGQMVDTFVYPAIGTPPPISPPPAVTTATVAVPPSAGLVATPISVEEGDRLTFAATGQVWVGAAFDDSGPDGRGTDPAGIGYPAPGLPPISLIGTIGSTSGFFLVGSASTHVVDDAEGTLSLGVNDFRLGDNWGPGYTCTVTLSRP
jgi:Lamin Tail Domain